MKITSFIKNPTKRVNDLNSYLKENFGITVKGFHPKAKLEKVREQAQNRIVAIKNTNKRFQMDPEYAKFLGVRDVIDVMIAEGMYAESPAYESMCNEVCETVTSLMDSGYTMDEACGECMNRFRKDSRYAYDDNVVMPIVLKAAKDYMESCGSAHESIEEDFIPDTDINENLLRELAKEIGIELNSVESINAIEEKLSMFAEVSGKSRDAVVGFLNGLQEDTLVDGIQMFGRKVAEANAFVDARRKAITAGDDEFEVDGKTYKVTGDTDTNESMFIDVIDSLLNEDVAVEQAEVVMAIRSLADDIQDQVERLGRMINEDLPAIVDQASAEFGAEQAASVKAEMEQALQGLLDGSKLGKDSIDNVIGVLTGTGPALNIAQQDAGLEEPVDDIAAASGPEEEPLGRAPVDDTDVEA